MSVATDRLRWLKAAAAVLAVANLLLFMRWSQIDPAPEPAPAGQTQGETDEAYSQAARADAHAAAGAAGDRGAASVVEPSNGTVARPTSCVLYGSISQANGESVSGGYCWLYRDGKTLGTQSLRDGTYAFVGLGLGDYRVRTRIDDQLSIDRSVVVDAVHTRLDIVLDERWLLEVRVVTPDGDPLLPAVAHTLRSGLGALAFRDVRTADLPPSNYREVQAGLGRFRGQSFIPRGRPFPKQTLGLLTLPPGEDVHVALMMRNAIVAQQAVTSGQEQVTFVLDVDQLLAKTCSVSLRLVDENGAPVSDARVAVNDAQTGGGGRKVDEGGRISIERLRPGRLDLEVRHRELAGPPVQLDLVAGSNVDLGDVVVRPFVLVELDLSNFGDGKGSVRFNMLDPPRGWIADDSYVSTENGASQSYRLYPGRYGLLATGSNGVATLELDVQVPLPGPVRFDLRRGAMLRIENGLGPRFARVEVRTPSGGVVRRRELTGTSQESIELPVGQYVAVIESDEGIEQRNIVLGRDGAVLHLH